jgi:hypothetical protein
MSLGFRAESTNTSGVITVAGVDQVVINNAGDVAATTFTGALVGNAATATKLSTSTGTAPVYGIRAWVNFDGTKDTTGTTSTANTNRLIRGSGNVGNVLRNGAGDYTVNFSVPMANADYAVLGTTNTDTNFTNVVTTRTTGLSTSSVRFITTNANALTDFNIVSIAIVG